LIYALDLPFGIFNVFLKHIFIFLIKDWSQFFVRFILRNKLKNVCTTFLSLFQMNRTKNWDQSL
jgi:hypothetical protein